MDLSKYLKIKIGIMIGILCLFPMSELKAQVEWYFEEAINGIEFWKNSKLPHCQIVKEDLSITTQKDISFYRSEVFFKDLQEAKKQTLSFLGINDWMLSNHQVEQVKDSISIHFTGKYTDSRAEITYFVENHLYHKNTLTQFLYTCSQPIPDPKGATKIFSQINSHKRSNNL